MLACADPLCRFCMSELRLWVDVVLDGRSCVRTLRPLLCGGRRLWAGRTLLLGLLCVGLAAGILLLIRLLLLLRFLLGLLLVLRRIHGVPGAGTLSYFCQPEPVFL